MTKKTGNKKQATGNPGKSGPSFRVSYFVFQFNKWWRKSWWNRLGFIVVAFVMLATSTMYGIAQWYIWSNRNKPVSFGATFISDYAEYFGLEPRETLRAVLYDLKVDRVRLVSYWDKIEAQPGTYDFSDLDWQFRMAEEAGVDVSLALGLRQPRWPECHMPERFLGKPLDEWYPKLKIFMEKVIERYKSSPALVSYQLENEFFLSVFGECPDFSRWRLIDEAKHVRKLDPDTTLIITRSNNAIGWPVGDPVPDKYGVSVYKRVWDKTITKRYFEYPFPAWFYGFLAGMSKITQGRELFIHELQTETWLAEGFEQRTAPIEELYKSLNPDRLEHRMEYGIGSGMKEIDLWGVEWWYQMKTERNAPELWETAKRKIEQTQTENAKLLE